MASIQGAGRHVAWVFALTGTVVALDSVFLFHQLSNSQIRSETFPFTVGFVLFQELVLFGSLIYVALAAGRSATPVPIRLGYVTVVLVYIATTIVAVLIFNLLLLPYIVSPHTYYTALIARTGTVILLLALIHVVGVIQRSAHREGELKRAKVDDLMVTCDRIRVLCGVHCSHIEPTCGGLAEQIRFCEGLRRNQTLVDEISNRLAQLESLVKSGTANDEAVEVSQLIHEIYTLAMRQH